MNIEHSTSNVERRSFSCLSVFDYSIAIESEKRLILREDDIPGESLANVGGGGSGEPIAKKSIGNQAIDGGSEALGLSRGDQKAGYFIFDHVADTCDVGGDYRNAGGHGLDQHQSESLGGGREDQ